MLRPAVAIVATCLLLVLRTITASAAPVHVGPGATFPTIYAAARAHAVHPGDTVLVHGGTYRDLQGPIDSLIGRPDAWITIMPYGTDSVSIHTQYTFQHAQYLRVERLHFFGNDPAVASSVFHLLFFDYNYDCFTANHDIIIRDCTFTDLNNTGKGSTGACLKMTGTEHFQVLGCRFERGTNITDGISLNADRHGIIDGCYFAEMPGDGSHCKGGALDITYTRNTFVDCAAGGLDVGGDTGPAFFCPLAATWEADSIHVRANIFIRGTTGIRLSSCHNSDILNNTCFKTTQFAFRSLNASSNPIYLENNLIQNNIFTCNGPYGIYMNASGGYNYGTETFKNNLFHDYARNDPTTINWSEMPGVVVSGSVIGDPRFTDTASGDFTLRAGSPAIGKGAPTARTFTDFNGRPYDTAAPSIGAFEHGTLLSVQTPPPAQLLTLTPNPSTNAVTVTLPPGTPPGAELRIVDMLGRVVLRHHMTSAVEQLDISSLQSGRFEVVLTPRAGQYSDRASLVIAR